MSRCGPGETIRSKERGSRLNLKRQHCMGYTTTRGMLLLDPLVGEQLHDVLLYIYTPNTNPALPTALPNRNWLFSGEGAEVIWCGLPSMLKSIGVDSLRIKITPELRNQAGTCWHNVTSGGKTAKCTLGTFCSWSTDLLFAAGAERAQSLSLGPVTNVEVASLGSLWKIWKIQSRAIPQIKDDKRGITHNKTADRMVDVCSKLARCVFKILGAMNPTGSAGCDPGYWSEESRSLSNSRDGKARLWIETGMPEASPIRSLRSATSQWQLRLAYFSLRCRHKQKHA